MERTLLALLVALLCAELLPALPVEVASAAAKTATAVDATSEDHQVRSRRKVGNVTITPRQYMEELLSSYTSDESRPTYDQRNPTDVWCFLDKDLTEGAQRNKSSSPHLEQRCSVFTTYVFNWKSLLNAGQTKKSVPIQRAILRAYLQDISRHLEDGEETAVNIVAYADYNNPNISVNLSDLSYTREQQQVVVSRGTNDWVEINITDVLQMLWPPRGDETEISVTVRLSVNCSEGRRKVPALLANPAEIPVEQETRRERNMKLQPLLVVFFSDEAVKEKAKEEQEVQPVQGISITQAENAQRKRMLIQPCRLENFTINFRLIGLENILTPQMVNVRKCVGSCTHTYIKREYVKANNYAKIMSSASVAAAQQPEFWSGNTPVQPSCVPTRYKSVYLMLQHRDGAYEVSLFTGFIAEECGCR